MISPDGKDWTWVLERPCPECGFDASRCEPTSVAELVRANAQDWQALHERGHIVAGRDHPGRWSTLEYACHVRDVYERYDERVRLMLTEDDPLYANWDQDASAEADRYEEQDPTVVMAALVANAEKIAARFDGVTGASWQRPGRRSDGASFTIDTLSRYLAHDPIHHIWDIDPRTPAAAPQ